jgi:NAD kinase
MVIPSEHQVEIHIEENGGDVLFKADGVDPFPVQHGDRIVASRSEFVTRLIMLEPASFYRKVRARYLYGERLNHPDATR